MRDLETENSAKLCPDFLTPQKLRIKECSFELLNFGVICYATIETNTMNKYIPSSQLKESWSDCINVRQRFQSREYCQRDVHCIMIKVPIHQEDP